MFGEHLEGDIVGEDGSGGVLLMVGVVSGRGVDFGEKETSLNK